MKTNDRTRTGEKSAPYVIRRIDSELLPDCNKHKAVWQTCPPAQIDCDNTWEMTFIPKTAVKLCYDDSYLYLLYTVRDKFVRCLTNHLNGEVWKDACVEFFFSPGMNPPGGYFNLEVNCGGTICMGYQKTPRGTSILITQEDAQKIKICHSLPPVIEQEIAHPIGWTIEIGLPFNILDHYANVKPPHSGVAWKANFYKCAENNSHPHWLSWKQIDSPTPDFHLPEFFGEVKFE